MEDIENKILIWANERGLFEESTPLKQLKKTEEEIEELRLELGFFEIHGNVGDLNFQANSMVKAGEVIVTMINICHMLGSDIEECIGLAYQKINKRHGAVIDGLFVADNK